MGTGDISAGRSAVVVIGGCFFALLPFLRDVDFLRHFWPAPLLLSHVTRAVTIGISYTLHGASHTVGRRKLKP